MEFFSMSVWSPLIIEALTIIILGLATVGMRWAVSYLKAIGITEQIIAKEELAMIIVGFVEQTYQLASGPEKFNAAVATLAARFKQYGLKISTNEIEELIENAVNQMQDVWAEELE